MTKNSMLVELILKYTRKEIYNVNHSQERDLSKTFSMHSIKIIKLLVLEKRILLLKKKKKKLCLLKRRKKRHLINVLLKLIKLKKKINRKTGEIRRGAILGNM